MKATRATAWIACGALAACCGVAACSQGVTQNRAGQPASSDSRTLDSAKSDPSGKTIGLALSAFDFAFNQSEDGAAECPNGLVFSERDNWEALFPSRRARESHLNRCGSMENRGPNCESALAAPELTTDPLPFREPQTRIAEGFDLDGETNGQETAATCAHKPFVSPDGRPGIDNQYYRLLGCHVMFQKRRTPASLVRRFIREHRVFWSLVEITGVESERNDDEVVVTLYRSRDRKVTDGEDRSVAWQTLRVDEDVPPQPLRGRIIEGELVTDPADLVIDGTREETRLWLRGASFRLKLTRDGAQGWRVGYVDVPQLWQSYASFLRSDRMLKGTGSGPSAHAAMYRLADGYKAATTGTCTALSSARKLEFVRVFIRHPRLDS